MHDRIARVLHQRAGDAVRQRRFRARRRAGKLSLRVEVCEARVITALIEAGYLSEAAALSREQVERALGSVIADWSALWVK